MTSLTDTQVVTASGGLVELGYLERTSNLGLSTGISPATSELVIGSISAVCDGSPVEIEFFASDCTPASGSGNYLAFSLYVDGVEHTQVWGFFNNQAASTNYNPVFLKRRIVPSAGVHTFAVRAYSVAAGGFIEMRPGGGDRAPGYLRVSKIVQATQWPAVTTGTIICTSTTRPASPFVGQKIYETDTKKELTYDGASWTQPWNQPWGIVGIGEHNTGAQVAANTSFCSVTFNPVLGRYYQAFYTSRTVWATAGTIGIFDSVANGRIAEQYGAPDPVTLQRTKTFSSTSSRTLSIRTDGVQTPISGSYSGQERPAQLVVMDVGPA
jgi:hypothetical protein